MAQRKTPPTPDEPLRERAKALGLWGLVDHFDEYAGADWLEGLLQLEEAERQRRSLERRIKNARIGRFKPLADFDWSWPRKVDRELIEDLFTLGFIEQGRHAVLVGANGVGKTTLAQNLAHQAVLRGHTARFTTASEMLNDLATQDGPAALARRLRRYCRPSLLVIDEVGYLSYDSRHADLLFEVVSRRHEDRSIVVTTNRVFREWKEVFPNATCVVALVDRLVHRAEIISIDADSYRLKEAKAREAGRVKKKRGTPATRRRTPNPNKGG